MAVKRIAFANTIPTGGQSSKTYVAEDGQKYTALHFTSTGSNNLVIGENGKVDMLIVGGGGAAARSSSSTGSNSGISGGGGGGNVMVVFDIPVTTGNSPYAMVVGAGNTNGNTTIGLATGDSSTAFGLTCLGGGCSSHPNNSSNSTAGGNSGGASFSMASPAENTPRSRGTGNAPSLSSYYGRAYGGNLGDESSDAGDYYGGGGGGAGGNAPEPQGSYPLFTTAADGGPGAPCDFLDGRVLYYGGGGGGGMHQRVDNSGLHSGRGGIGGGGGGGVDNTTNPAYGDCELIGFTLNTGYPSADSTASSGGNGGANTGGGGGGCSYDGGGNGGDGGSGIIVIRFPVA